MKNSFGVRAGAPLALAVLCSLQLECSKTQPTAPSPKQSTRFQGQNPRRLYGRAVLVRSEAGPVVAQAAKDVADYLSRATNVAFAVKADGANGIALLLSNDPLVPKDIAERLRDKGRSAYVRRSTGDGRLLIVANHDDGLVFGAYQYLETLGIRFYFPSEHWTIVPQLADIEREEDQLVEPAFRMRQFVGTGGYGKAAAVDPEGRLSNRWETWKRRNGFGEEFHIDGHAGEGFNVRNREILLAHPEYLATVGGKRTPWSKAAKLDPTNEAGLKLYVADRLREYASKRARDPGGPGSFAVSVEPSDGGGHCDSTECERLGSVSDRAFFVANAVAKALRHHFPGARASLFAYNSHAKVPDIKIEPNVYVTIVPYAFQQSGEDPKTFIQDWSRAKSPLSIYDYWSIPDWVHDLPSFDFRTVPAERLRYWRAQKIEGVLGESSYSAGAIGLAWFVAGHLMWSPEANESELIAAFFRDSFRSAAPPLQAMLERWASGFLLNSIELRASFANVSAAFTRTVDTDVLARVADYAAYLQYLRLRYELVVAPATERVPRKRALLRHIWRIRDSAMVNTHRLQQLLLRGEPALATEFDAQNIALPIWRELAPPTLADAQAWIAGGLRDFPDLGVVPKQYGGPLVAVPRTDVPPPPHAWEVPLTLVGSQRLHLSLSEGRDLSLPISAKGPLRVRLFAGREMIAALELTAAGTRVFSVLGLTANTYRLELLTGKNTNFTLFPIENVDLELEDLRVPKAVPVPDLYFYVPRGLTTLAIFDPIALPPGSGVVLIDATGKEVPLVRRDGGRLLLATVTADQSGRTWRMRRAVCPNGSLRLLNAPQRLSLTSHGLRVPQQALAPLPRPADSQGHLVPGLTRTPT
jgi:Domain of unknown function (DUF4838)